MADLIVLDPFLVQETRRIRTIAKKEWYRLCVKGDIEEVKTYYEANIRNIDPTWLYTEAEIEQLNDSFNTPPAATVAATGQQQTNHDNNLVQEQAIPVTDAIVDGDNAGEDHTEDGDSEWDEERPLLQSIVAIAGHHGHLSLVQFYISEGFDPHIGFPNALLAAEERGNYQIVKYLLECADFNINNSLNDDERVEEEDAITLSAAYGRIDRLCYFVSEHGSMVIESDLDVFLTLPTLQDCGFSQYIRSYFLCDESSLGSSIVAADNDSSEIISIPIAKPVNPTTSMIVPEAMVGYWDSGKKNVNSSTSMDYWGLYDSIFMLLVFVIVATSVYVMGI